MNANWISDYEKACSHALTVEWFVSPLEFSWGTGKEIAEKVFRSPSSQNATLDKVLAPELYKTSMQFHFRAQMLVYAFMREPIAKKYALEIESGLIELYGLDFLSCLSQWIYVVEGYSRQLFHVTSTSNVNSASWHPPTTGDATRDKTISTVCKALGDYLDKVVYRSTGDTMTTTLSRHLMLHGNLQNKAFYSQKNCLSVMFVLDALVFIEMVINSRFPQIFEDSLGDAERISRRKRVYEFERRNSMEDTNLLKIGVLSEHL